MTPFNLQAALKALDRSVTDVERAETDCSELDDDDGARQAHSDAAVDAARAFLATGKKEGR